MHSEEELLRTNPSSSPLSLIMSSLGIKDSSFLYKLETSNGELKLSGYISGPCCSLTTKVRIISIYILLLKYLFFSWIMKL